MKTKLIKAKESNTPILNTLNANQKVSPEKKGNDNNINQAFYTNVNNNNTPIPNAGVNKRPANNLNVKENNVNSSSNKTYTNLRKKTPESNVNSNLIPNNTSLFNNNSKIKKKTNPNTGNKPLPISVNDINLNSNVLQRSNTCSNNNTTSNLNKNIAFDKSNLISPSNTNNVQNNTEGNNYISQNYPKQKTSSSNVSKSNTNPNNNDNTHNSYTNITIRRNSSKAISLAQSSLKKSQSKSKPKNNNPYKYVTEDNIHHSEIQPFKTEESDKSNKPNREKITLIELQQHYAKIKEEEEPIHQEVKQIPMLTKEEIEENIQKIFLNNAKYSHKKNDYYILHHDLMKLLMQSKIISHSKLKSTHIELLFKKINGLAKKITQQGFMSLLMRISKKIQPEEFKEQPKETFNAFITFFFESFNHIISDKYKDRDSNKEEDNYCNYDQPFKSIETLMEYIPDSKQRFYISKILYTLREIYVKYFTYETDKSKELSKQSYKNLIEAMRDLEIYPFVINDTQLMTYYNLTVNQKPYYYFLNEKTDIGQDFTLEKFCLMIVHLSILSYIKTAKVYEDDKEKEIVKLIIFLERIENSRGMRTFVRKLNRPSTSKLTLICSKEVFDQLGESVNALRSKSTSPISNDKDAKGKKTKDKPVNLRELLPQCNISVISLLENNLSDISKTFLYFSNFGDKLNYNQINISCYMKLLKHCGLLKEIPKQKQEEYFTVSKELMEKTRHYLGKLKGYNDSPNNQSVVPNLTKEEQNYKKVVSKIVNTSSEDGKIGESDVNIIFSSLTGPKNFDYNDYSKRLLDKNYGYCTAFNIQNRVNQKDNNQMMLRMNFSLFIKSLELISKRLHPKENQSKALYVLLTNNIIPNAINEDNKESNNQSSHNRNDKKTMDEAYDIMQARDIQSFLKKLAPALSRYYTYYCDDNKNISFNSFLDFYKNFGLFPDIVSLIAIKNIFFFLIETNKKQSDIASDVVYNSKEAINFNSFVYSIGLAALTASFEEKYSSIDKMLYLIERINQSDGVRKMHIESGRTYTKHNDIIQFLLEMKKEYPQFYQKSNLDLKQNDIDMSISFDDLYC